MLEYIHLNISSLQHGNTLIVFSSKILTELRTGINSLLRIICFFMHIKA